MGLEDRFGASDNPSDDTIPVHQFSFALREYARGKMTRGEILTAVNGWVEMPLSASEQTDAGLLADLIDAIAGANGKVVKALEVGDVLGLAELNTAGYQTRAELKAKIGF